MLFDRIRAPVPRVAQTLMQTCQLSGLRTRCVAPGSLAQPFGSILALVAEKASRTGASGVSAAMPMVDLNNTMNFNSAHNMHKWGGANIGRLAAPRLSGPRALPTPRTLRSVTLSHPLSSMPDEVINPPNICRFRQPSNSNILSMLTNCSENSPRLSPFDRTRHQPRQDMARATTYVLDYGRPASVRSHARSGAIGFANADRPSSSQRSGFSLPSLAHLDAPYTPYTHGLRASIRPKQWHGPGQGED